ncbi:MAG: outer membrane beta-barrel protein, partial [Bacteroidota bacterium]
AVTSGKACHRPVLSVRDDLNSAQTFRLQYRQQVNFFDVEQVALGLRVQNYNNLRRGTSGLENSLSHNVELSYTNFSMFSHLNFFAFANYQRRIRDLSEALTYEGLQRITTPLNLQGANDFLNVTGQVTKTFEKWRVTGSATLMYNSLGNVIDEQQNRNNTWTQRYRSSIATRLFKVLTLDVGYRYEYSDYQSDFTSNTFINHNPNAEVGIRILPSLTLDMVYNRNRYIDRNLDAVNTYQLLDATLSYQRKDSPWQCTLHGTNLTGTQAIRRNGFSDSLVSDYAYFVLPRYFLLTLAYEI